MGVLRFLALLVTAVYHVHAEVYDPLSYVNLFIGTVNGGNTFPGTTWSCHLAKPGAETLQRCYSSSWLGQSRDGH